MLTFDEIPKLAEEFAKKWAAEHPLPKVMKVDHSGYLLDGTYMKNKLDNQDYYKHYGEKGYK